MQFIFILTFLFNSFSSINSHYQFKSVEDALNQKIDSPDKAHQIEKYVLAQKNKALAPLLKVMKTERYPIQSRWMASILLSKVSGKYSLPVLRKYTRHPHPTLRSAALKGMLLNQDNSLEARELYKKLLSDQSMLVRMQSLENIRQLAIKDLSKDVVDMLYDEKNYLGPKGNRKRTPIISSAVRALGDLRFVKMRNVLQKMKVKKEYYDIRDDIEYSLAQLK